MCKKKCLKCTLDGISTKTAVMHRHHPWRDQSEGHTAELCFTHHRDITWLNILISRFPQGAGYSWVKLPLEVRSFIYGVWLFTPTQKMTDLRITLLIVTACSALGMNHKDITKAFDNCDDVIRGSKKRAIELFSESMFTRVM